MVSSIWRLSKQCGLTTISLGSQSELRCLKVKTMPESTGYPKEVIARDPLIYCWGAQPAPFPFYPFKALSGKSWKTVFKLPPDSFSRERPAKGSCCVCLPPGPSCASRRLPPELPAELLLYRKLRTPNRKLTRLTQPAQNWVSRWIELDWIVLDWLVLD